MADLLTRNHATASGSEAAKDAVSAS
jgi:hypothetical protein